jgi:hypothetical protein
MDGLTGQPLFPPFDELGFAGERPNHTEDRASAGPSAERLTTERNHVLQRVIRDARAGREVILSWSELESSFPGKDFGQQWKRMEQWSLENKMWFVKDTASRLSIDSRITFYSLSVDESLP